MSRFRLIGLSFIICQLSFSPAVAQKLTLSVKADSTFDASNDNAQTFKGADVDMSKVNVINIAMQIAQDVAAATTNDEEITSALPNKTYYRQRADLVFSSALPERTNVYSTVSFLNTSAGVKDEASVIVTNLEIEHYFTKNLKMRVGRLGNTVSESQFFGQTAEPEISLCGYPPAFQEWPSDAWHLLGESPIPGGHANLHP